MAPFPLLHPGGQDKHLWRSCSGSLIYRDVLNRQTGAERNPGVQISPENLSAELHFINPFVCLPAEHKPPSSMEIIFRFFFYSLSRCLFQLVLGASPLCRGHQQAQMVSVAARDRKMNLDRGTEVRIHLLC